MIEKLRKNILFRILTSVKTTVTCLGLLFILTFWGTIDQVYHGLYHAQETFFHSWGFFGFGFLPFPGAQLVLWVLFVNLMCVAGTKFVFKRTNIGILVIHFGLLAYFVSAFVTLQCVKESNVMMLEGSAANVSSAYHDWELSLWRQEGDVKSVIAYDLAGAKPGKTFDFDAGLTASVQMYYGNTQAFRGVSSTGQGQLNASGIQAITELPLLAEPEKNMPGGIFRFEQDHAPLADVLLYAGENVPASFKVADKIYFVQLRRKRFSLPFLLKLVDFKMENHPNTAIARSYQSLVEISTGDLSREVLISMNRPLRYKDFTVYQASYSIDALGREYSTLAVVKNVGRVLPYVASLLTFAGLALHFILVGFSRKFR